METGGDTVQTVARAVCSLRYLITNGRGVESIITKAGDFEFAMTRHLKWYFRTLRELASTVPITRKCFTNYRFGVLLFMFFLTWS